MLQALDISNSSNKSNNNQVGVIMREFLSKYGFTPASFFQLILITVNAQLIYAFWDIRNSVPGGFPAALGVTDQQAGYLYSMQGLVIILGTIALGWVGDRFSIRSIMLLSTVGVGSISLFLTLSSPGLSMSVLLACFFLCYFLVKYYLNQRISKHYVFLPRKNIRGWYLGYLNLVEDC